MSIAYGMISRELFRGMQFEMSESREPTGEIRHELSPDLEYNLLRIFHS